MSNDVQNVFDAILKFGHDEDFAPMEKEDFNPTEATAGSDEKVEILRRRKAKGGPGLFRSHRRCPPARELIRPSSRIAIEKGRRVGVPFFVGVIDLANSRA